MKCEKLPIKSNNSLECFECHKMIHLKCSRLRANKDLAQFKKSKLQFVCQFCSNYTCLKCNKHAYYGQKGVLCSGCNLWVHQKCAGLTNLEYKVLGNNSEEPWYCRICKANMLPFYNLTTNQFLNFIESNNNIPPPFNQTFKDVNTCSICNRKNKKKMA